MPTSLEVSCSEGMVSLPAGEKRQATGVGDITRLLHPEDPPPSSLSQPRGAPYRIILYSHDTMGLGHKRRNLLIAQTLAQALPHSSILLITGMVDGSTLSLPPGVDYLALPALRKHDDGHYEARRLEMSLKALVTLRSKTIRAAVKAFKPDLLLVDNVPRGVMGELDRTLAWLQRQSTRCVLAACDRIAAALPSQTPVPSHRDFYPDQVRVAGDRLFLLDLDLYAWADPGLDIGNCAAHLTEYSLRILGDSQALAAQEEALIEPYLQALGAPLRPVIETYRQLTLVRHLYISTRCPERHAITPALLDLCEAQLAAIPAAQF